MAPTGTYREEGLTYQEQQAWEAACTALAELNGTLSLHFESAGSKREFEIIYIPLPTNKEGTTT
jgi:hypothetical protein